MSDERKLPAFQSEAEEANWWYENREQHAEQFAQAMAEGRVKRNGLAQRVAAARGISMVALEADDIAKARTLAEQRGMDVSNYLTLLVHEALERLAG